MKHLKLEMDLERTQKLAFLELFKIGMLGQNQLEPIKNDGAGLNSPDSDFEPPEEVKSSEKHDYIFNSSKEENILTGRPFVNEEPSENLDKPWKEGLVLPPRSQITEFNSYDDTATNPEIDQGESSVQEKPHNLDNQPANFSTSARKNRRNLSHSEFVALFTTKLNISKEKLLIEM